MNKTRQKSDDSESSFISIPYKLQEENIILSQSQSHSEHISAISNRKANYVDSMSHLTNQQYNDLNFKAPGHHLFSILTNSYPQQASSANANDMASLHYPCQYDPITLMQPQQQIPQTIYSQDKAQRAVHCNKFFYRPYNDFLNYHIKCEKVSLQLLNNSMQSKANEYIFYYQQQNNNQIYQISCEIASSNYLNKKFYGIEIEPNMEQKQLVFTSDQQENLKFYLSQYLGNYLFN
ncbi:unnamed protein product [Rhizophagus irregularis]|uniref:Uncharacterized protein n=1 Tax=Rhizophagus irregularis TaxID=588596 RepID=A0A2N1NX14_9GLOM|nr:hypothetical protein RhiirC2_705830 [Rhizophagus irregularis]CAB4390906.1 unnamed protein product [Rhizophagus irregularis]CAB5391797.1 unnamed protein product [Rhizophagus irregularis]